MNVCHVLSLRETNKPLRKHEVIEATSFSECSRRDKTRKPPGARLEDNPQRAVIPALNMWSRENDGGLESVSGHQTKTQLILSLSRAHPPDEFQILPRKDDCCQGTGVFLCGASSGTYEFLIHCLHCVSNDSGLPNFRKRATKWNDSFKFCNMLEHTAHEKQVHEARKREKTTTSRNLRIHLIFFLQL